LLLLFRIGSGGGGGVGGDGLELSSKLVVVLAVARVVIFIIFIIFSVVALVAKLVVGASLRDRCLSMFLCKGGGWSVEKKRTDASRRRLLRLLLSFPHSLSLLAMISSQHARVNWNTPAAPARTAAALKTASSSASDSLPLPPSGHRRRRAVVETFAAFAVAVSTAAAPPGPRLERVVIAIQYEKPSLFVREAARWKRERKNEGKSEEKTNAVDEEKIAPLFLPPLSPRRRRCRQRRRTRGDSFLARPLLSLHSTHDVWPHRYASLEAISSLFVNENEQQRQREWESLLSFFLTFFSRSHEKKKINHLILFSLGSMFCLGMSTFGFLFMGLLGHLLSRDYQWVFGSVFWREREKERERGAMNFPLAHLTSSTSSKKKLTTLKKKNSRYLGEWYEPKAIGGGEHVPSYEAQRKAAVSNCWKVAWMYAACGAASAAALALGGRRRWRRGKRGRERKERSVLCVSVLFSFFSAALLSSFV
jgi:hypothetical protein